MGWIIAGLLALAVLLGLWRLAGFGRADLQLAAAAMLIGLAGYAWQGRPGQAGEPKQPVARRSLPDTPFASTRHQILGRFDDADRWLTIADGYHRSGRTQDAVGVIRSAIRAHPRDSDLWIGLGNALVVHGEGLMSPAAEYAFRRASALAPNAPGPPFYYALALAQAGRLEEAERIWLRLLATAPPDASWRPLVQNGLAMAQGVRAMERAAQRQRPMRTRPPEPTAR